MADPAQTLQYDAPAAPPQVLQYDAVAPKKSFLDRILDEEIPLSSTGAAFESGAQSIGRGVRDAIKGAYDLFSAPKDDPEKVIASIGPGVLPIYRTLRSAGHSVEDAAHLAGAIRDINQSPDPTGTYLKAAQDTAGEGAGQALTALATDALGRVAPSVLDTVASPTKMTAPVRAAVKGVNVALAKAPATVGTAAGAAIGAATHLPYGSEIGAGIGSVVGKELLPKVVIPGENFGLPKTVQGGPVSAPQFAPQVEPPAAAASAPEPAAVAAPEAPAAAVPAARSTENLPIADNGESILRDILAGQDNKNLMRIAKSRGINVTKESQLKPGVADKLLVGKIVDDFSDEELENIRNQALENSRFRHQFGDIGPEAWKTMSLQSYFPDVKIPAAELKRTAAAVNAGKTATTPGTLGAKLQRAATAPGPTAPSSVPIEDQMQEMLKQVKAGKKLSDLSPAQQ